MGFVDIMMSNKIRYRFSGASGVGRSDTCEETGTGVREGKRRQLNFIGKSLREVEPELMDASIEATEDVTRAGCELYLYQRPGLAKIMTKEEKILNMITGKRRGCLVFICC